MRHYEWTTDEVDTLYSDIVETMERDSTRNFELSQIILTREDSKDNAYQVIDGQQRLVTVFLLYAAVRDNAVEDGLRQDVQERLLPGGYGKKQVMRLTLRKSENDVFKSILSDDELDEELKSLLKTKKKKLSKTISEPALRMLNNYAKLCELLRDKHADFIESLYCFLNQNVYLYATIPESKKVARRLCMGARKGKDTEPIDELKGMVIYDGIDSDAKQIDYFERWTELEETVGRGILSDACLLMAQAELRERVKRDQDMDKLEDFLKLYNDDGITFFDEIVLPGAKALRALRDGHHEEVFGTAGQSVRFIRDIAKVPTAKEIEIAALHAIRRRKQSDEILLQTIERTGLLFATTTVDIRDRAARVFSLVDAIENGTMALDLSPDEEKSSFHSLYETEWGVGNKKKCVNAILQRMNAKILAEKSQAAVQAPRVDIEHVLPQKPREDSRWKSDWRPEELATWTHRLGNLCLLNPTRNSAAGNHDFSEKRSFLARMPFPLTSQIASDFESWTPADVQRQHHYLLLLASRTFRLMQSVSKDFYAEKYR